MSQKILGIDLDGEGEVEVCVTYDTYRMRRIHVGDTTPDSINIDCVECDGEDITENLTGDQLDTLMERIRADDD